MLAAWSTPGAGVDVLLSCAKKNVGRETLETASRRGVRCNQCCGQRPFCLLFEEGFRSSACLWDGRAVSIAVRTKDSVMFVLCLGFGGQEGCGVLVPGADTLDRGMRCYCTHIKDQQSSLLILPRHDYAA